MTRKPIKPKKLTAYVYPFNFFTMILHITLSIFAALALHLVAALPGNLVTIAVPTVLDRRPAPSHSPPRSLASTLLSTTKQHTSSSTRTQPRPIQVLTLAAASNAVAFTISNPQLTDGFDCTITGANGVAACQGDSRLVSPTETLVEVVLDVTATLTGGSASASASATPASGSASSTPNSTGSSATEQSASSTSSSSAAAQSSTKPNGEPRVLARSSVFMLVGPLVAYHLL
ncbi:hypothetical protein FB45DRAFT_1027219 [Roridomyces roridus]|uniref:Uncharacterized protein n=1 Tax=Roridomyces roridus TaxID=1738132 RepID=A0AAD7FN51_9AGAR|nr:hypothetical protein FB45DRAFT_1027219 [Roridomyces roridus]